MDEDINDETSWEPYVWRGIVGGVIGHVSFILLGGVFVAMRFGAEYLNDLLLIGGILSLIGGAIIGLAVGFVIYKLTQRWRKQPGSGARIAIGSASFFLFLVLDFAKLDLSVVVFSFVYAILVGGLAGLMARAKTSSAPVSISTDRA
jgi:hypothetical protein